MGFEPIHAVRWATYADLGILFGAPLFALGRPKAFDNALNPEALAGLAGTGLALSLGGFVLVVAAMGGTGVFAIDPETFTYVLTSTAVGWAFLARMSVLLLILLVLAVPSIERLTKLKFVILFSAVAVGSLAWSGHAAASEGVAGAVRLAGDIAHVLAASAWVGALVILFRQVLLAGPGDAANTRLAWEMLSGFAVPGSVIVGIVLFTGLLNAAFLFGPADVLLMPSSPYGQLLLIKLVLFGVMLCLAALNRFTLTPALARRADSGELVQSIRALRLSTGMELTLAIAILALVGWLGTLEPLVTTAPT